MLLFPHRSAERHTRMQGLMGLCGGVRLCILLLANGSKRRLCGPERGEYHRDAPGCTCSRLSSLTIGMHKMSGARGDDMRVLKGPIYSPTRRRARNLASVDASINLTSTRFDAFLCSKSAIKVFVNSETRRISSKMTVTVMSGQAERSVHSQ